MLNIRLVSNLKNHFSEVEAEVIQNKKSVFLIKNSYLSMVVMSLE